MAVGTIYKRCTCQVPVLRPDGEPVVGEDGKSLRRRLGATCPKLKRANGVWNPLHGTWCAQVSTPRTSGPRRATVRLGGLRDRRTAERFLLDVHALWALADGADEPEAARWELTRAIRAELRAHHRLPDYETMRFHLRAGHPVVQDLTVAEYLISWLCGLHDLRAGTRGQYESAIRVYLLPHLGHLQLRRLRTHHVQQMFTDIIEDAERIEENNAARYALDCARKRAWIDRDMTALRAANAALAEWPSYCRTPGPSRRQRIRATLRSALTSAVHEGLIESNPATHVRMTPEHDCTPNLWTDERVAAWRETGRRPSPIMVWTPRHTAMFLDHASSDPWYPIYYLIAHTGLRRGEALGLRWTDISMTGNTLTVAQQLVQHAWGIEVNGPKTQAAKRAIALSAGVKEALLTQAERQRQYRKSYGPDYINTGSVFSQPDGSPLIPAHVSARFRGLIAGAGLPPIRLHDLRHGAATFAHAAGADMKTISKMLGHADIAFTIKTYGAVLDDEQRNAADAIAALINNSRRIDHPNPKLRPIVDNGEAGEAQAPYTP